MTTGDRSTTRRAREGSRRVGISEVVEAAALADVAAAICVASRVLPITGAAILVSSVAFGLLGSRRRLRVVALSVAVGATVAFLFGGYSAANMTASAGAFGGFAGIAIRRRWSLPVVVTMTVAALGVPAGVFTLAITGVFVSYRELLFDQVRNSWKAAARLLNTSRNPRIAQYGTDVLNWILEHWVITMPALAAASVVVAGLAVYVVDRGIVIALRDRLRCPRDHAGAAGFDSVPVTDRDDEPPVTDRDDEPSVTDRDDEPPAPVPLHLRGVGMSHPGAPAPALRDIDLDVYPGEFLVVAGPNGAGKSTLAQIIAGDASSTGEVTRPGAVGRGRPGGTAVIGQRPETGVLGLRVADDIAWGTTGLTAEHIDLLLRMVGLDGMGGVETSTLSGGQLQRLALASALVYQPALVVSDESTAMLDLTGRRQMMTLFRRLAVEYRIAVVHITHDPYEISCADRVFTLTLNSEAPVASPAPWYRPVNQSSGRQLGYRWGAAVSVHDLAFAHDAGTPWEKPVFNHLSMSVASGEMVLVTGPNGVGKSTLARLLVGAQKPTAGEVLVDNAPTVNARDVAILGHQFSRLALIRGHVRTEVRDAAGVDAATADRALAILGLDPSRFGNARIDELSLGQQRRVALAGLVATRPRLLVLDEPFAGLDDASRTAVVTALRQFRADGITVIVATHDTAPFIGIADRTIELPRSESTPAAARTRSRASMVNVVGRVLPGPSPAQRLWSGTKIAAVIAVALMFAISPTWMSVAIAAGIAVMWSILGKVPLSALPRLPIWLVALVLFGGAVTGFGAGIEGVLSWLRLMAITVISLYISLLLCWTTPMVEIPGLFAVVSRTAARVRVSMGAFAVAVSVGLRLCPFIISNVGILVQTNTQRRSARDKAIWGRLDAWMRCLGVACTLAVGDARELAQTMRNRGHTEGQWDTQGDIGITHQRRGPKVADLTALAVVAAIIVAGSFGYP